MLLLNSLETNPGPDDFEEGVVKGSVPALGEIQ